MGRLSLKTSAASLVLTALIVLCLIETISLLEMSNRVGARAEARGATAAPSVETTPTGSSNDSAASASDIDAGRLAGSRRVSGVGSSRTSLASDTSNAARSTRTIECTGRIEAKRENVQIGTLVAGVVAEVYVERGDAVKKGDPLFRVDDREFRAQLAIATANLAAAEAQLDRLNTAPQTGDVSASEATVEEARAHMGDAERTYRRSQTLYDRKVESAEDRDRDRYAYIASKATLARLEAEVRRLKATWEKDKMAARASVAQAQTQVEAIQTSLSRVLVRASVDGRVLHVGVRPGQFAGAAWNEPLILLGDSRELVVRVDVDEDDLATFAPGSSAVATLKGRPDVTFPLVYFDAEPGLITRPAQADAGSRERRVLQVLYDLPPESPVALYVGQEMTVAIAPAAAPRRVASLGGGS